MQLPLAFGKDADEPFLILIEKQCIRVARLRLDRLQTLNQACVRLALVRILSSLL